MENQLPALELKNICKAFPGVKALTDVSLTVWHGDVLGLVGENGAGKSTLIKILSGAYTKDSGEIIVNGKPVNISNPQMAIEAGIAVIYQELSQVRQMTAVENMFLGRWMRNRAGLLDWKGMTQFTRDILNKFCVQVPLDVPMYKLSVALGQMVEIVKAVSWGANIIVMDEPTSSLSNAEVEVLFSIIQDLHQKGITVIYISHRLEELFRICNRVSVLKDGRNSVEFPSISNIGMNDIIGGMIGRELENYYPKRDFTPKTEVLMSVKNVKLDTRVKNVSFDVHKGEILGFAGLVGAGRTEIMRSIFKAETNATAEVYIENKKVKIRSPKDAIKSGIAFATEDRRNEGLILVAPISHNITMANMDSMKNKYRILDPNVEKKIAEKYKANLKIRTPSIQKAVGELSGGNQQKVVIAKWLNSESKVFIFDEPTRGIDVGSKAEIYQLMSDIAEEGNAVIMVSSELPEILGVCDRIIVIREGEIASEYTHDEVTEDKIMMAAVGVCNK